MWIIILKSILALVSIFTGGAIFYKHIKDNKILVFLAGSVSILSAVYLFSEVRRDIDTLVMEKKVESKVEQNKEEMVEVKKVEPKKEVVVKKVEFKPKIISTWFSPTEKKVTWRKAKELCEDNGGRLPTIEELKEVILGCGGKMKDDTMAEWTINENNQDYQSCYKRKGFNSHYYWSSFTAVVGYTSRAWVVNFGGGDDGREGKHFSHYVRCVRDGQ